MTPRDWIDQRLAELDHEARAKMLVWRPPGRTGRGHWSRANADERRRFAELECDHPGRVRLMVGGQTHALDDAGVWRRWRGRDLTSNA